MLAAFNIMPYVREKGIASGLAGGDPDPRELLFLLLPLLGPFLISWQLAVLMNVLFAGTLVLFLAAADRRIGGITGDTAGAAGEITEALILFIGCI
jgi:cobalamin synthase